METVSLVAMYKQTNTSDAVTRHTIGTKGRQSVFNMFISLVGPM